jgi:hypothetical protein
VVLSPADVMLPCYLSRRMLCRHASSTIEALSLLLCWSIDALPPLCSSSMANALSLPS